REILAVKQDAVAHETAAEIEVARSLPVAEALEIDEHSFGRRERLVETSVDELTPGEGARDADHRELEAAPTSDREALLDQREALGEALARHRHRDQAVVGEEPRFCVCIAECRRDLAAAPRGALDVARVTRRVVLNRHPAEP